MIIDIVILLLLVFFISILTFHIFNKTLEGFSLGSPASSSSSATNSDYDYLSPLPADNTWSEETQKNFIKKFNDNLLSRDPSATLINTPNYKGFFGDLNYLSLASEAEANYYVENGKWLWDNYINNYYDNLIATSPAQNRTGMRNFQAMFQEYLPNRSIYKLLATTTLPQTTILSSLNPNIGGGLVLPIQNQYLTCKSANKGVTKLPDGSNLIIPADGVYPYVSSSKNTIAYGAYTIDYSIFESIPGLTFDGSACNICQTPNFNYFDPSNNCSFSIKTPEAYNVYLGNNIKSPPSVASSSTTFSSQ